MSAYFVTATDTDAGKTFVTANLLKTAAYSQYSSLGFKPVASGIELIAGDLINQDISLIRAASSVDVAVEVSNQYLFEQAIAPHIAAKINQCDMDMQIIIDNFRQHRHLAEFVLVEGVGGWEVPLSKGRNLADLAAELKLAVLIVVRIRIGCINHALLTINAVKARGLPIAGWIANYYRDNLHDKEVTAAIEQISEVPCLAKIPVSKPLNCRSASLYNWCQRKPEAVFQDLFAKLHRQ